jgi:hypothetical protein
VVDFTGEIIAAKINVALPLLKTLEFVDGLPYSLFKVTLPPGKRAGQVVVRVGGRIDCSLVLPKVGNVGGGGGGVKQSGESGEVEDEGVDLGGTVVQVLALKPFQG